VVTARRQKRTEGQKRGQKGPKENRGHKKKNRRQKKRRRTTRKDDRRPKTNTIIVPKRTPRAPLPNQVGDRIPTGKKKGQGRQAAKFQHPPPRQEAPHYLRLLGLMQKNKVMELGSSRFFID
jgi:hypothetical protein